MTEAANITEIEEPTEETDGWAPTTTLEPARARSGRAGRRPRRSRREVLTSPRS